jgi:hypothetical protein
LVKERAEPDFRFGSIEHIPSAEGLVRALQDFYPAGMGIGGLWILYVKTFEKRSLSGKISWPNN